ncbi:MAG: aminotransferase class III-fold pyridoxal phosphate-dependent enzyme, partial [Mesorhizobium sp.]
VKLIEERDLVGNARRVGAHLQARLRKLASHPLVGEVRGVGLIAAVELVADKASKAPWGKPAALGALVNGLLQQNGVISRNMGDAIAFCPPLIITEPQVDTLVDAFERSLDAALPQVHAQG